MDNITFVTNVSYSYRSPAHKHRKETYRPRMAMRTRRAPYDLCMYITNLCNTLQHSVTHCDTLQHTVPHKHEKETYRPR